MRLSIATKIFIAFAGVVVVFTMVLMFGIYRTRATYAEIQTVNITVVPLSLLLSDIQTDLKSFSLVLNERDSLVLRRTLQVTRLGPSVPDRLRHKIGRATELADGADFGSDAAALDSIRAELAAMHGDVDRFADDAAAFAELALREPQSDEESDKIAARQSELRDSARELDERLTMLRTRLQAATDRGLARARQVEKSSLYALSLSAGVALAIALVLMIAVLLTIRRITDLSEATRRIAEGDYRPLDGVRKPAVAGDEIEALRDDFDSMVRRLEERDQALREQHAQLLRSERLATIGRMTSLITHELRNPLSSINLNSEMLAEALVEHGISAEHDDLMPVLETIIAEVDRLRDITEEYLVYARLPTPKREPERLGEIVQGLVDFHAWEWAQLDVEVELDLRDEPLNVDVDANQIRQALLNLIRNAVEASPPGAEVEIRACKQTDVAMVIVTDRGSGIASDDLDRVFEPFFTTKGKGTGLGLAMTQQIVEEHDGLITVESTPGEGTSFTIALPLAQGA